MPAVRSSYKTLTLNSYAKLNLYLEVLAKRKDGYHNLRSLFERINLSDTIVLRSRADNKIRIESSSADIPLNSTNLCVKAAILLQKELSRSKGVDILLKKRIPVASGMGGGSGNAAAVLLGLNKLWGMGLSRAKLVSLARKIGADVPFFVHECSFALAGEKGDKIFPLKALGRFRLWHVVVVPRLNVPTPLIFREWDRLKNAEISKKVKLTLPGYNVKILAQGLEKNDFALVKETLFNSLQQATFRRYPKLLEVRQRLTQAGLKNILMSGSGPALFGICSSSEEARKIAAQLGKDESRWRIFCVSTA
jgi:4-diphosphocytidyl-2-C-methyl-D-erythritol kinase